MHGVHGNGFMWDRCNDNIDFGMKFSRAFLDAREVVNDARALLNKHNNEAGRRVSQLCFALFRCPPRGFHFFSFNIILTRKKPFSN